MLAELFGLPVEMHDRTLPEGRKAGHYLRASGMSVSLPARYMQEEFRMFRGFLRIFRETERPVFFWRHMATGIMTMHWQS
ncbi:MAG: hypothetical protein V8S32_07245 [Lachnospiraceae bacterium]